MSKATHEPVLKTLKISGDVEQNKTKKVSLVSLRNPDVKKLDNRAVFSSFVFAFHLLHFLLKCKIL